MSKWNLVGKEIEGEFRDACFGEEKINGLDLSAKYYLKKGKKKKKYLYFSKEKVTMKIIWFYIRYLKNCNFYLYDKKA